MHTKFYLRRTWIVTSSILLILLLGSAALVFSPVLRVSGANQQSPDKACTHHIQPSGGTRQQSPPGLRETTGTVGE